MNCIAVAFGGAIGSLLRYILGLYPIKIFNYNITTILINIIGSFAIGLISAYILKNSTSSFAVNFIKVGLCGGFTTFSTFSLELFDLINKAKFFIGFFYIFTSVAFSLFAIFFAYKIIGIQ